MTTDTTTTGEDVEQPGAVDGSQGDELATPGSDATPTPGRPGQGPVDSPGGEPGATDTDTDDDDVEGDPEGDGATGRNREAAKYRVRLREAEAAREAAVTERDAARAQVLDLLMSTHGGNLHPAALGEAGVRPEWDAVAGADAQLDPAKLAQHLKQLRTSRPYLFEGSRMFADPIQGTTRGGNDIRTTPRDPLASALSRGTRGG
ncbi:hypothetical protein ACFQ80_19095 [Isoptericola sp. NPDC056578]|uniref:hypothetical protein n=1 Tax=Isoptericola sp. NPDC056578 TaxID=3345870 RepID=UPI0036A03BF2